MKTKTEQIFEVSAPYDHEAQGRYHRALFVCSAGILRSATAATIGSRFGMNTRNCGTSHYALIPLSANLIEWAHRIYFVNDYNYIEALNTFSSDRYLSDLIEEKAEVWNIPDCYDYMEPELVAIITELIN